VEKPIAQLSLRASVTSDRWNDNCREQAVALIDSVQRDALRSDRSVDTAAEVVQRRPS